MCIQHQTSFFLFATELHCCPKTMKNTSMSHSVFKGNQKVQRDRLTHCWTWSFHGICPLILVLGCHDILSYCTLFSDTAGLVL